MCIALIRSLAYTCFQQQQYRKLVFKPTMAEQDLKKALLQGIWRMCVCVCVFALCLEIGSQKSENKVNSAMPHLSRVSHCILKSHKDAPIFSWCNTKLFWLKPLSFCSVVHDWKMSITRLLICSTEIAHHPSPSFHCTTTVRIFVWTHQCYVFPFLITTR